MSSRVNSLDMESVALESAQWQQLEREWGPGVDLDEEDKTNQPPPQLSRSLPCSSWHLNQTTFDSADLLDRLRTPPLASPDLTHSIAEYEEFAKDLEPSVSIDTPRPVKDFYYVGGNVLSHDSVESICAHIDQAFRSMDQLNIAGTSTVRGEKIRRRLCPIEDSISTIDLSFHESTFSNCFSEDQDVSAYIDGLFRSVSQLDHSVSSGSISRLVESFTAFLDQPDDLGRRRISEEQSQRFAELRKFWQGKAKKDST